MKTLGEILKDKFINGFVVALIFGIGTLNAVNTIGGSVLDKVLGVSTTPWNWKVFIGQLILYMVVVIVAIIVRLFSRISVVKTPPEN